MDLVLIVAFVCGTVLVLYLMYSLNYFSWETILESYDKHNGYKLVNDIFPYNFTSETTILKTKFNRNFKKRYYPKRVRNLIK